MAKRIVVSEKCVACGLCTTVSSLMEEQADGTVLPNGTGILNEADETEFLKVIAMCPQNALSLETVAVQSKESIISQMNREIENFDLETLVGDLEFDADYIDIDIPDYVDGEDEYEYDDDDEAQEAGKEILDEMMYSHRKEYIQEALNTYRIEKLSRFYEYENDDDNFYYQANQKAQSILNGWLANIRAYNPKTRFSENTQVIQTEPGESYEGLVAPIQEKLLVYARQIFNEMYDDEDLYSLDNYSNYFDTDDMDVYDDEYDEEETKYCFQNMQEAFEEIVKDIKDLMPMAMSDCEEAVENYVGKIVDRYTKDLKRELSIKARNLQKLL